MSCKSQKLGVIAGNGALPGLVVEAARKQGYEVCVIGIINAYDPMLEIHHEAHLQRLGKTLSIIKKNNCTEVVIVGGVTRPNLLSFVPDFETMKFYARVALEARKNGIGDDTVLRILVSVFEEHGITIRAANDIIEDIMAPTGVMTKSKPTKNNDIDINRGQIVTDTIGELDIGQCCVVCRGQVLAVEGPEGTDEMLKRVAHLSTSMRGSVRKREGVLVKLPKPNQDRRIDMPTIGLTTIENASLAGLSGIAFAGEATQLIDADACVKRADELGMFLIGLKP